MNSRFDPGDKAEWFQEIASFGAVIICLLFPFTMSYTCDVLREFGIFTPVVICFIWAFILLPFGVWAVFHKLAWIYRRVPDADLLNKDAANIITMLRSGQSPPPYWVYLRPFSSDQLYSIQFEEELHYPEFENFMARALEPMATLVALGKQGKHHGFGKIETSDSEWEKTFAGLATHASGIIILALNSPGVLREISILHELQLVERCIFVVMPGLSDEVFKNTEKSLRQFGFDVGRLMVEQDFSTQKRGILFTMKRRTINKWEWFMEEKWQHGGSWSSPHMVTVNDIEWVRGRILKLSQPATPGVSRSE